MTPLLTGQEARFDLGAAATDGTPKPATFSAQISGFPGIAYITVDVPNHIHVVATGAGNCTVTVTGKSANGTDLPVLTIDFTVSVPTVPDVQADHFTNTAITVKQQDITTPPNPGSDTVSGAF